jgi:hypothetical protein
MMTAFAVGTDEGVNEELAQPGSSVAIQMVRASGIIARRSVVQIHHSSLPRSIEYL